MNTNKFQYWPSNGQMGSTKFTMPTNAEDWPSGDALVGNFVYNEGKLVDFIDTKALVANSSGATTFPYDYVNITVDKSLEGLMTFTPGTRCKYFNISYAESGNTIVLGTKYLGCKTLNDIKTINPDYKTNDIIDGVWSEGLGDLTNGDSMFAYCTNLTSFSSDLSSLTEGVDMFYGTSLATFSSDLSSLEEGYAMFNRCTNLATFSSDLSSLTTAEYMFCYCPFESFSSDLSNLIIGERMFAGCSNLTSFSSDLPSLKNGKYMFDECKLDALSVKNMIDTINRGGGDLVLGIGCDNTTEDKNLFAKEVGYTSMTALLRAFERNTNWYIEAQYNGRPTTTYSLRRSSEDTLPVFVKLEEIEEHANYTSEDGSKKYRLNYFHETTGSTEGYTQFSSLEEAIEYFNIKPVER